MTLKEKIKKIKNFRPIDSLGSEEDFVVVLKEILANDDDREELKRNSIYRDNIFDFISYLYIVDKEKMKQIDKDALWVFVNEFDE